MWHTDVFFINGWVIYRVYEDGCLANELMERVDFAHDLKDVINDIRGAEVMANRYGSFPKSAYGKNLYVGKEGQGWSKTELL